MSHAKLIRQGIKLWVERPGEVLEKTWDGSLIRALLVAKLSEEGQEVARAPSRQQRLEELGDLYEVIHSLAAMDDLTIGQVHGAASRKADERGPLLTTDRDGRTVGLLLKVGDQG